MVHIKTKEGASLWIALLATAIVAVGMVIQHIEWWITLCTSVGVFVVVALAALFIIRKYVAYKLKPIYSIVLSRDVHTNEIFSELKDKRVENIGEELTAWADTNDREIARLKEAECFRKQYLGNVAHELKTPIFNIQGYISTLLDGGLEDELINRKYLERAEKSIDRLINIVNDLDTISKLESSMNKLNLERFDVVALAKEIAEQAEMEADRKEIRISVKGTDNLPSPFWVLADKHYIGQVFVNLIINSIRYGKEGGQTRIRFRDMLDKILIEVEDNGSGIAKEDLPRVFERFYRTDKGRSREQGGTGLGLAISKMIVEKLDGTIGVDSELGKGTRFHFSIPVVHRDGSKNDEQLCAAPGRDDGKSWVLLVAEDSDTNFRLIEAVLSRRFSLVRAHTGAEAVDMFGTVQPDAVLMDIRMPVMDGLEATRRIRSVSADVPIIAMSAYSSGSEIESARNAGCNEFLVKPLSQYSLHRALNAALVEFKGKGKS